MKRLMVPTLCGIVLLGAAWAELEKAAWPQWGQNPQHTGFVRVEGQAPKKQLAQIVYDPFVPQEQTEASGDLLVHYQVPLIQGNHVYMEFKTGTWIPCSTPGSWRSGEACGPNTWNQEIWNEKALAWREGKLVAEWNFQSDWKPEPNGTGLSGWEPVFHAVLSRGFLYVREPAAPFGRLIGRTDTSSLT